MTSTRPNPTGRTTNKLVAGQMFKVMAAVEKGFRDAMMSDPEFAAKLTEELSFEVPPSSVQTAREQLDPPIPSITELRRQALTNGRATLPDLRLHAIEQRLRIIDKLLDMSHPGYAEALATVGLSPLRR